jgi:hypothetical protein
MSMVLSARVTLYRSPDGGIVTIHRIEIIRSRVGYLYGMLTGPTLAKVWVLSESLRYGLRPLEIVRLLTNGKLGRMSGSNLTW